MWFLLHGALLMALGAYTACRRGIHWFNCTGLAQFCAKCNDIPFQSTGENTSGIALLAENFKGTPSDTQMELTWDKAPSADGYIISAAWDWVDSYREIAQLRAEV